MPRIKITDLPKNLEVGKEEMKRVVGGLTYSIVSSPYKISYPTLNPAPFRPFFSVPSGEGEEMQSKCGCMGMPQDPAECMLPY